MRQLLQAEFEEHAHPVQGFGNAGRFVQVLFAQALHEGHGLFHQSTGRFGHQRAHNVHFARQARKVQVVKQAAAAQRVRQIARAIAGQHHQRFTAGAQGAQLGNTDLKLREHFQQKRFKGFVRAVDFVNQQDARHFAAYGLQQRALQQKFFRKQIAAQGLLSAAALTFSGTARARFGQADFE